MQRQSIDTLPLFTDKSLLESLVQGLVEAEVFEVQELRRSFLEALSYMPSVKNTPPPGTSRIVHGKAVYPHGCLLLGMMIREVDDKAQLMILQRLVEVTALKLKLELY